MRGLALALGAYGIWGCFPLYFTLLSHVPAFEVLAQRIVWAYVITLVVIVLMGRSRQLLALVSNRKALAWLALSSALISVNWFVFIWAVADHRVLETSLGYFMTPLVSLMLGRILLREAMNGFQLLAGILAGVAVLFELIVLGRLPWVSLTLALSFGFYGLVRKQQPVDSLQGLQVETLLVLPFALVFLGRQWESGALMFGTDLPTTLLLIAAGLVTAIPLLLFALATARLDLTVVGFIMYLNPSLQFLTAVFILNEDYPPQRIITFIIIWIAMAFFLAGLWRHRRQLQKSQVMPAKV